MHRSQEVCGSVGPLFARHCPFGSLRSPERALPTETNVESGTSQSKSGTSVNFSSSGDLGGVVDGAVEEARSKSPSEEGTTKRFEEGTTKRFPSEEGTTKTDPAKREQLKGCQEGTPETDLGGVVDGAVEETA